VAGLLIGVRLDGRAELRRVASVGMRCRASGGVSAQRYRNSYTPRAIAAPRQRGPTRRALAVIFCQFCYLEELFFEGIHFKDPFGVGGVTGDDG